MIFGWLKAWLHGMWGMYDLHRHGRSHRLETTKIGWVVPILPIGYDCECGKHIWHSKRHVSEYRMIRAAVPLLRRTHG